jgi:hypothetical protein
MISFMECQLIIPSVPCFLGETYSTFMLGSVSQFCIDTRRTLKKGE